MKRKLLQQATVLKCVEINEYSGTTARAGEVIDCLGYQSAIVSVSNAAATGSPSAATLTLSMVEGDTNSPATSVTIVPTASAISCLTAGITNYHFDLRPFKRYVKFTLTPAFTDGSTPKVLGAATITLGDKNVEPVPSAVSIYSK